MMDGDQGWAAAARCCGESTSRRVISEEQIQGASAEVQRRGEGWRSRRKRIGENRGERVLKISALILKNHRRGSLSLHPLLATCAPPCILLSVYGEIVSSACARSSWLSKPCKPEDRMLQRRIREQHKIYCRAQPGPPTPRGQQRRKSQEGETWWPVHRTKQASSVGGECRWILGYLQVGVL